MNSESSVPPASVLVIDDEAQIRRLLRVTLEGAGYRVVEAASGGEGVTQAAQCRPDLILLDLGLPDLGGLQVLRRIREWSPVPVVILSVRDGEAEKVEALDGGADDYVTKPFYSGELLARIRAALRHAQPRNVSAVHHLGELEIDLARRVVLKRGAEVRLTPIEYALLRLLVTHTGKVLTHRQLLREVWGEKATGQTHYLRVHLAHLREKLEAEPSAPRLILTEPGVGYRLVSPTPREGGGGPADPVVPRRS